MAEYFGPLACWVDSEVRPVVHSRLERATRYIPPRTSICAAPHTCWAITCGLRMATSETLRALSWMRRAGTRLPRCEKRRLAQNRSVLVPTAGYSRFPAADNSASISTTRRQG